MIRMPWTLASGWNLDKTVVRTLSVFFGEKTVYVWGVQMMASQLTANFVFTLRIGYFKDTTYVHESPRDWIHPWDSLDKTTGLTVTIGASDLDSAGIYWLKDETTPIGFVASRIRIEKVSGPNILNLDFVGTYYEYDTAKDGKYNDGKADNWNTDGIDSYLIKGILVSKPFPALNALPRRCCRLDQGRSAFALHG